MLFDVSYGVYCDLIELVDVYCFQCLVCFAARWFVAVVNLLILRMRCLCWF